MKTGILILICLLPAVSFSQNKLSYRFSMDTSNALLHVSLQFTGTDAGTTKLKLPDEWAGRTELYRAITSLTVSGKNAVIVPGQDSAVCMITHAPHAKLTVNYTLKQDFTDKLSYPLNFRAVISKNYFQCTGYSLLIRPETMDPGKIKISLNWSEMPSNWTIGNSFHATGRSFKGSVSMGNLDNAVFVAGDFRSYKTTISGKPVYVAIRGNNWTFEDSMLVNRIQKIITMERRFWNDFSEPYYFVSLIPFDSDGGGYNGTALHQSFMLAMDKTIDFGMSLNILIAHEYFHRWNGTLIVLKEDTEQENSWFSEGFTEYYTYKLLFESGILSQEAYLAKANSIIAAYYLSPVRNEDKTTLGKNFWNGRDYTQIHYNKGFVYALLTDDLIRTHSEDKKYTLNDVMFDLWKQRSKKDTLSENDFIETVSRYAGTNIANEYRNYIVNGETIPVFGQSMGEHLRVEDQSLGAFDVGFDLKASSNSDHIIGTDPESEAYKAGLRDGQTIRGWSIYGGDISMPAEVTVMENGEEKTIIYKPMSKERVTVPQLVAN